MDIVGSIPEDAKAIDVASGTGIFARQLAPLCKSVIAFDATDAMLKQAERKSIEWIHETKYVFGSQYIAYNNMA